MPCDVFGKVWPATTSCGNWRGCDTPCRNWLNLSELAKCRVNLKWQTEVKYYISILKANVTVVYRKGIIQKEIGLDWQLPSRSNKKWSWSNPKHRWMFKEHSWRNIPAIIKKPRIGYVCLEVVVTVIRLLTVYCSPCNCKIVSVCEGGATPCSRCQADHTHSYTQVDSTCPHHRYCL